VSRAFFQWLTGHTGPRRLVFHPTLPVAYVVNEQGSSVTAYNLEGKVGTLTPRQALPTLPKDFNGTNACADVEVRPSGRFVHVSHRGHDSVVAFSVDAKTGRLSSHGQVPTERTPREFTADPAGHFIHAAGESSGRLAAYRIDQQTGQLKRIATYEVGRQAW